MTIKCYTFDTTEKVSIVSVVSVVVVVVVVVAPWHKRTKAMTGMKSTMNAISFFFPSIGNDSNCRVFVPGTFTPLLSRI